MNLETSAIGLGLTILGAVMGAGITWGVMSQTIREQGKRLAALEARCDIHRKDCPSNLHEKLNSIKSDLAYIRGKLEGKAEAEGERK